MRKPVQRIGDAGRHEIAGISLPVEAHHHFGVEIHPLADGGAFCQLQRRRNRINAKTAHAVFQLQGERFDPYPDVGDPAPVQP
ncbi:hypothetical protein ExPUPEC79_02089 [Escherichia coli]|nr:hypothetical protein ExPUPEC79_02089 [Escherichia coli]